MIKDMREGLMNRLSWDQYCDANGILSDKHM